MTVKRGSSLRAAAPGLVSVLVHLGVFALATGVAAVHRTAPRPALQEITVILNEAPPPPPPAPVAAPAAPAPPTRPLAVVRHQRIPRPAAPTSPPPTALAPPPPNEEAPTETPPPIVVPGVALSATSQTGTMAVRAGNTSYGQPSDTPAPAPKPYRAAEYAEEYALSEPPSYLDNVSAEEVRRFYPPEARKSRREGVVRAKVLVDDDGSVARVTVVEHPGHGFDAAARAVGRLYRFKPGRLNGRAVATEILVTIRFDLD